MNPWHIRKYTKAHYVLFVCLYAYVAQMHDYDLENAEHLLKKFQTQAEDVRAKMISHSFISEISRLHKTYIETKLQTR